MRQSYIRLIGVIVVVCLVSVPIIFRSHGSSEPAEQSPARAPDFQDTAQWVFLRDATLVNLEFGIPWSISRFYVRVGDPLHFGMETILSWDSVPVFKMWGRTGAAYQAIRTGIGEWSAPIREARTDVVIRIDQPLGKAIGIIIMIYDGDAAHPLAHGVFNDPDYSPQEQGRKSPALSGSF